ncbi:MULTISPECIES: reverse transcriptase domain-containing protein [Klebsiella]|uniref:reverse transcriptase domain-containing protein n=1 Tax=Klebsiella TaxID=570 RepID=UPI0007CBDFB8|nr:reverse transcriptase domain-containing protein [Klebsiella pneumoniae]EHC5032673.1 reverse transcriptase [Escherichia coli]ELA2276742.1 reverse transcriptase [Klebsiella aerogenes]ELS5745726.1 reverse transcriptase [Klebsiella aerogenes]SAX16416.1 Retron-type reverse transcriptase [Klebsiella pneumoniae]HBR0847300.1 reverse transcriptase [Klebsiella pneumoniae]
MKPTWLHKFEVKENRWVYIPDAETHQLGQKIHTYIKNKWKSPLYMFHLREGGHVAAANYHLRKKYFSLIDISNFFGATSQSRVTRELGRLVPYVKAREIARLSTVKNLNGNGLKHVIPYGYPQSPILASLCFHQSFCGSTINTISKSGHVSVSIFMDDILLSSDDLDQLQNAFDIVLKALRTSGYTVNEDKTQPPSLMVSVFNLELSQNSLRVTSKRIVEFLQAFISSKNSHERKGIASYVGSINTAQAKLFR